MRVLPVKKGKRDYLSLLLLADPEPRMIDRYLDRGELWVLEDGGKVRSLCVVTDEGCGVLELKNLAVWPENQRRGYGARLVAFLARRDRGEYRRMQVGTGESPLTIPFYERCGFAPSHRVKNFFPAHYDHPIYECGRQLIDMVYLTMPLDGQGSGAGD